MKINFQILAIVVLSALILFAPTSKADAQGLFNGIGQGKRDAVSVQRFFTEDSHFKTTCYYDSQFDSIICAVWMNKPYSQVKADGSLDAFDNYLGIETRVYIQSNYREGLILSGCTSDNQQVSSYTYQRMNNSVSHISDDLFNGGWSAFCDPDKIEASRRETPHDDLNLKPSSPNNITDASKAPIPSPSIKSIENGVNSTRLIKVYSNEKNNYYINEHMVKSNLNGGYSHNGNLNVFLYEDFNETMRRYLINSLKHGIEDGSIIVSTGVICNPDLVKYQVLNVTLDQKTKMVFLKETIFIDVNNVTIATQQANETFILDSKKYQTLSNAIHGVKATLQEAQNSQDINDRPPANENKAPIRRGRPTAEQVIRALRSMEPSKSVAEKPVPLTQPHQRDIVPPDAAGERTNNFQQRPAKSLPQFDTEGFCRSMPGTNGNRNRQMEEMCRQTEKDARSYILSHMQNIPPQVMEFCSQYNQSSQSYAKLKTCIQSNSTESVRAATARDEAYRIRTTEGFATMIRMQRSLNLALEMRGGGGPELEKPYLGDMGARCNYDPKNNEIWCMILTNHPLSTMRAGGYSDDFDKFVQIMMQIYEESRIQGPFGIFACTLDGVAVTAYHWDPQIHDVRRAQPPVSCKDFP